MNIRNFLLLAGLAVFIAGCVVNPSAYNRNYDHRYDDDYYYDYRNTPSYEGYYYVRIIFIRNVPYYVDDDRYIRPIPPRLHDHFRRYPYNTLGYPPLFSRDTEVRDGYPMSRIIYLDGVPYHVENDHIAQPLPERLHQRFRYTPANQGSAPANGFRPQPFGQHDNGRNNEPPALNQNPGTDLNHEDHRDRERIEQPPFTRLREGGRDTSAEPQGMTTPSPNLHSVPQHQDQPNAGESHAETPHGQTGNRPQPADVSGNRKADKNKSDKKKSHPDKKNNQGDGPKADDNSGNKREGRMKPRPGKDSDQ